MDVPPGFDPTLILVLNLVGTFVFGVVVLAAAALAGGVTRDLLIGVPPATFRDWRYPAAVGAAGLVCYSAGAALERIRLGPASATSTAETTEADVHCAIASQTTPIAIRPIGSIRPTAAGSPSQTIPAIAVPIAPMPTQTA